jgi:hypothetical protein
MAMKNILALLLVVFAVAQASANEGWKWATAFGDSSGNVIISALGEAGASDILVAGTFDGQRFTWGDYSYINKGREDAFVAKLNNVGELQWVFCFGGEGLEVITAIEGDPWGNVHVAGYYSGLSTTIGSRQLVNKGNSDAFVIRLTPTGDIEWIYSLENAYEDQIVDLKIDSENNIIVAAGERDPNITSSSFLFALSLFKLNPAGVLDWKKMNQPAALGNSSVSLYALHLDNEDNCYLTGYMVGTFKIDGIIRKTLPVGQFGGLLLKFDKRGNYVKGVFDQWLDVSASHPNVGIISFDYDGDAMRFRKFNFNLEVEWTRLHLGQVSAFSPGPSYSQRYIYRYLSVGANSDYAYINSFISTTTDTLVLPPNPYIEGIDTFFLTGANSYPNIQIYQFNASGGVKDSTVVRGNLEDLGVVAKYTKNNQLVFAGTFGSDRLSFADFSFINTARLGYVFVHRQGVYFNRVHKGVMGLWGDRIVNSVSQSVKDDMVLYPNPSQDHFFLRSEAFSEKPVQVQLFSTDGKLLSQQNILPMGNSLRVETTTLPPGLYIVNVISNGQLSAQRFVKY